MVLRSFLSRRGSVPPRPSLLDTCTCIDESTEVATIQQSAIPAPVDPSSGKIPAVARPHLANVPGITYVDTPPIPVGGDGDPILLPNERLLQRYPNKRSMLKISDIRTHKARRKCQKCTRPSRSDVEAVDPWSNSDKLQSVNGMIANAMPQLRETSLEYLSGGAQPGTAYVTTERILFVPTQLDLVGFSIEIEEITAMKVLESDTIMNAWYFVCYVDNSVSTIPFMSEARAMAFRSLIANLQFEHRIRRCLPPPKYTRANSAASVMKKAEKNLTAWEEEDRRLPSYNESEFALQRLMVSKGLLQVNEPLDREANVRLIAQASLPPTDH